MIKNEELILRKMAFERLWNDRVEKGNEMVIVLGDQSIIKCNGYEFSEYSPESVFLYKIIDKRNKKEFIAEIDINLIIDVRSTYGSI